MYRSQDVDILEIYHKVLSHTSRLRNDGELMLKLSIKRRNFMFYAYSTYVKLRGMKAAGLAISEADLKGYERLFL